MKLQTPTPTSPPFVDTNPWVSQTPYNPTEALSQIILVRDRITCYQGNSPIPFFQTIVVLAKSIECLAYELTLANTELRIFRVTNKVLSKYYRTKKNYIRQKGILIIKEAYDIIAQNKINKQIQYDKYSRKINRKKGNSTTRYYSICGKTSYNTRTCQEVIDISSLLDSEE
jgi:hypothetical protein